MTKNTVFQAIVGITAALLIPGLVLGIAVSDVDILNPRTSAAKQAQIEEKNRHQREMNFIEEQRQQLALERDKAKAAAQMEREQELARTRAPFIAVRELILTIVLVLAGLVLCGGIILGIRQVLQSSSKPRKTAPAYIPVPLRPIPSTSRTRTGENGHNEDTLIYERLGNFQSFN